MKAKKRFIVLLCLCMALCFCSCTNAEKAKPSLGYVSNNVYENEFIGIGCKLDSEWTFLSNDEILEQNQLTTDLLGDEYKDMLEATDILTCMMANHRNGISINVQMEKLPSSHSSTSAQQYVDASKNQISRPLRNMGVKNIVVKTTKIDFAGKKRPCLTLVGDYYGNAIYEVFIPIKCTSGYMAGITVCTFFEDTTEDVLSNFYALD